MSEPFYFPGLNAAQQTAWQTTLEILREISAFQQTEVYTPSDHQAAWDAIRALEYLMQPPITERIVTTKTAYERGKE